MPGNRGNGGSDKAKKPKHRVKYPTVIRGQILRRCFCAVRFGDPLDHPRHSRRDPGRIITLLEQRQNIAVDHPLRQPVINRIIARAQRDPHFAVVAGDQDQHAVVAGGVANTPGIKQLLTIGFNTLPGPAKIRNPLHDGQRDMHSCLIPCCP